MDLWAKIQKKMQNDAYKIKNPENQQVVIGIYIDLLYTAIINVL